MKPLYANSSKRNRLLRGIACILLVATVLMMSGCSELTYKLHNKEVKQNMETYLKERYSTDFEVKPYLFESAFWSNNNNWEAEAYPAGQPEIKFKVQGSKSSESINYKSYDDDKYTDDYLKEKWSYQAKQEIEKKLREVYGPEVDFKIGEYEFVGGSYAFKDLDFDQVFEKDHGHGHLYINYDIFMNGTQFNKEEEAKKAYQILKPFVLDYGSNDYVISILYIDKVDKLDYLANSKLYFDKSIKHDYPENKDKKILDHFWLRKSSSKPIIINSSNDIIKFSEY